MDQGKSYHLWTVSPRQIGFLPQNSSCIAQSWQIDKPANLNEWFLE